jgi:hypothetical protein
MTALEPAKSLPLWAWGGFLLFIATMLALDLGVFRKKSNEIKMKEALVWCGVWFSLAMGFNGVIWWWLGSQSTLEWSTGYLVELCLSVDNVFVFILIFTYFKVPAHPPSATHVKGEAAYHSPVFHTLEPTQQQSPFPAKAARPKAASADILEVHAENELGFSSSH